MTSDAGSHFHSWLIVFVAQDSADPCMGGLDLLGCAEGPNDNTGVDTVNIPIFGIMAGQTYFFMVDGFSGGTGGFSLAARTNPYTGIDERNLIKENVNIFPNPATNSITVGPVSMKKVKLSIVNSLGETVYENNFGDLHKETIDVSTLAPGIYFLELRNNFRLLRNKFVINR